MRVKHLSTMLIIGSTVLLTACQTTQLKEPESSTVIDALSPIEKLVFTAGESFTFKDLLKSEELVTTKVLDVSDSGIRFLEAGGCEYTVADLFSPATAWKNCGGSGSAKVVSEGNIWPLQVGNSVSYEINGTHNGQSWSGTRVCNVESAQNIQVDTEFYDTFKVLCKRDRRVRTFYMTASQKQPLIFQYSKNGQDKSHQQLVY